VIRLFLAFVLAIAACPAVAWAARCPASPLSVQVLGSGGPFVTRDRASASYLVWIDGQPRILVDAGGGASVRFGQAEAQLADLSLIAISHLHPDHVSDLPALLWLSDAVRKDRLAIAGPSGNDDVPDFKTFLTRLFDQKTGAFQVLGGLLGAAGRGVPLDPTVVDVTKADATSVLNRDGVTVTARGIPHGNIPALAFRVSANGASIVLSTDQTGTNPAFVDFARDADVLVMHLMIGAGAVSPLHASPEVVGRVARDANARRLVLGHIGQFDLDPALSDVKKNFTGPLVVAADLQCTPAR
jgi:ribonuclease BN (tRNA processing enzyme)